jgi:hypothetical protein
MEFLNFAFQDFWHFVGCFLFVYAPLATFATVISAWPRKVVNNNYYNCKDKGNDN